MGFGARGKRPRGLRKSLQYLLAVFQRKMTVSANLHNTPQNFHKNRAGKMSQKLALQTSLRGSVLGARLRVDDVALVHVGEAHLRAAVLVTLYHIVLYDIVTFV